MIINSDSNYYYYWWWLLLYEHPLIVIASVISKVNGYYINIYLLSDTLATSPKLYFTLTYPSGVTIEITVTFLRSHSLLVLGSASHTNFWVSWKGHCHGLPFHRPSWMPRFASYPDQTSHPQLQRAAVLPVRGHVWQRAHPEDAGRRLLPEAHGHEGLLPALLWAARPPSLLRVLLPGRLLQPQEVPAVRLPGCLWGVLPLLRDPQHRVDWERELL